MESADPPPEAPISIAHLHHINVILVGSMLARENHAKLLLVNRHHDNPLAEARSYSLDFEPVT
jgi:hypothetical protein